MRIKIYYGKELYFLLVKAEKLTISPESAQLRQGPLCFTSSCQVWGLFPGLRCIFEEADILLESKKEKLSGVLLFCSLHPSFPLYHSVIS